MGNRCMKRSVTPESKSPNKMISPNVNATNIQSSNHEKQRRESDSDSSKIISPQNNESNKNPISPSNHDQNIKNKNKIDGKSIKSISNVDNVFNETHSLIKQDSKDDFTTKIITQPNSPGMLQSLSPSEINSNGNINNDNNQHTNHESKNSKFRGLSIETLSITQPISLRSPVRISPVLQFDKITKSRDSSGRRILCDRYVMLRSIGSGGVATVELCYDLILNCHLACKKMSKRTLSRQREYAQGATLAEANQAYSSQKLLKPNNIETPSSSSNDQNQQAIPSIMKSPSIGAMSNRPRVQTGLDKVAREISIMKQCWNSNIVKLYSVIDSSSDDGLYIIMEYCQYGQIMTFDSNDMRYKSNLLKTNEATLGLLDNDLKKVIKHVCSGLMFLHSHNIIHRDVKPDNLLCALATDDDLDEIDQSTLSPGRITSPQLGPINSINQYCIKLADLGVARQFPSSNRSECLISDTHGTFHFFSPEMCSGDLYDPFKSDLWSLGITIHILATGRVPFMTKDQAAQKLFDKIQNEELSLPTNCPIDKDLKQLIISLLCKDPNKRISLQEILSHSYMTKDHNQINQTNAIT